MTTTYSKSRQQAEIAFGKTQMHTQTAARERAFDELDSIAAARDEKTQRLRLARIEHEAQEGLASPKAPARKRAVRS